MRKTWIVLVTAALVGGIALAGATKKKVLIAKTTTDAATRNAGAVVGEKLCSEAFKNKKIESFCASTLEALMKQQSNLAMLGGEQSCTGGDCTALYAKRVAAEYLVTSEVKKLGSKEYMVSVQLVRFADAKTIERFETKVSKIELTYDAAAKGAAKVLAKL